MTKSITRLRWAPLLLLLVATVLSLQSPAPVLSGDAVGEDVQQRLDTISDAIADAYQRGDEKAGERLACAFRLFIADERRHRPGFELEVAGEGIDGWAEAEKSSR
jgi:hypothetical protein